MSSDLRPRELVFRSGHLYIAACVAALIWCLPNLQKLSYEYSALSEAREPIRMQRSAMIDHVNALNSISQQAIARLKTGACIPMVNAEDGKDVYFSEVSNAIARTNGQPLVQGQLVCNAFGETGIVGVNGEINSIAVASVKDREEYDRIYQQLLE